MIATICGGGDKGCGEISIEEVYDVAEMRD